MSSDALRGKVAVITGAAGGIGRVLVGAFLQAGAKVTALDIDAERLASLGQELHKAGHGDRYITRNCDIAVHDECAEAVDATLDALGGVHILINNAAMGMGAIRTDHMTRLVGIDEITPAMWTRFVMTNLSGAWFMTRAVIGQMQAQRWGRIITVTTSFFTMLRGKFHPYGPCKAGLEAMAAGHAEEFKGTGVTVNVVVPGGPADTPMVPAESGFAREDLVPPQAMAPPMLWLCGDAADVITGNRYVAADWRTDLAPEAAEAQCRVPIAWPELARSPVWPGGKPNE